MAGRGRGRGGRGASSNFKQAEVFGLSKEDLKPVCEGPPPIFPPLIRKPLDILEDEKLKYCMAIRQEFRDLWLATPSYHIQYDQVKKDIERYRDRFEKNSTSDAVDRKKYPAHFPKELLEGIKKRPRSKNSKSKKKLKLTKDLGKTLENLEMKEKDDNEDDTSNSDDSDEDEVNEAKDEDTVEDELDEGTDYGMSYFDNGENYIDDEEENFDDGPVF